MMETKNRLPNGRPTFFLILLSLTEAETALLMAIFMLAVTQKLTGCLHIVFGSAAFLTS
jgi:hypothetical protein